MAKFCGKCGSRLDEATGLCPNCDAEKIKALVEKPAGQPKEIKKKPEISKQKDVPLSKKEARAKRKADKKAAKKAAKKERKAQKKAEKKAKKKEKWAAKPWWKKILSILIRCLVWLLVMMLIATGIVYALIRFSIIDMSLVEDALVCIGVVEQFQTETVNADEYFQNNATIVDVIDASISEDVLTESQVFSILRDRGFTEYPITCNYSMDGTYDPEMVFSENSTTMHPMYETYYITSEDEVWTIFVINGAIMAQPVSYNLQSGLGVEVLLSETNTLTSYDGVTNQFYETIPNDSTIILKTVDRIDAETLETLTNGVIDDL